MHPPPCIHTSRRLCNQMILCVVHLMFPCQPNFHHLLSPLQCLLLIRLYWLVFTLWHPNHPLFEPLHPSNNLRTWCHLLSFRIDDWLWKWKWMKKNTYHDPNFRLMTKARAWKDMGWKCNPRVTFTLLAMRESVKEWTHTFPNGLPLWELESLWTSESLEMDLRGQNSLD
jgi:hypothetical protein